MDDDAWRIREQPEDEVQLMLARISHVAHIAVLLYFLACLRVAFYSAGAAVYVCVRRV